jgi:hypothetical protein
MKQLLCAFIGAALAAPALAKDQPIQLDIAPGKVGEVCMALGAGDSLAWEFDASAPLDFNLHHHVGKKVLMPVERKAVAADRAEHRADRRNDWCLMWTAPAAQAVTVRGHWRVRRGR